MKITTFLTFLLALFSSFTIAQTCTSDFNFNVTNNVVDFTEISSGYTSPIFNWHFDDGATSAVQNPQHTYLNNGTYQVKLAICDGNCWPGCSDSITYNVVINYSGCYSDFSFTVNQNLVQFSNESFSAAPNYWWDFGDGATSTSAFPQHYYSAIGTYNVCLIVDNGGGCTDTLCQQVTVNTPPPACSAVVNTALNQGSTAYCSVDIATTTGFHSGTIDYGDGQSDVFSGWSTSTTHNFTHVYANGGNYVVCATMNNNGCTSVGCDTVTAYASTPTCEAIYTGTDYGTYTWDFLNTSIGSNLTYLWDFGDGTTDTQQNPTHVFAQLGIHQICLTIDNGVDCLDQLCYYINVVGGPCSADYSYVTTNNVVDFTELAVGTGLSYYWDFGDGGYDNVANPTHAYAANGTYNAKLRICNANCFWGGCVDSVIYTININYAGCVADFSSSVNQSAVSFDNLSFNSGTSYFWDFGDGTTSFSFEPLHAFINAGTYTVCLTVDDGNGCTDTFCDQVTTTVQAPPCMAFFQPNVSGQNSFQYDFMNLSTIDSNATYLATWDWGDGLAISYAAWSNSLPASYNHTYATSGTYNVCLTMSYQGLVCTYCDSLVVYGSTPTCDAAFTYDNQNGQTVAFTDQSIGSGLSYLWDFGDGNTSTLQNPSHTYATSGNFTVSLIITNSATGCLDIQNSAVLVNTGGWISGNVFEAGDTLQFKWVYLIKADSVGNDVFLSVVDSVQTDGFYSFSAVGGIYYVKAAMVVGQPDYNNFQPTYFGDEFWWGDAAAIYNYTGSWSNDIDMIMASNSGGPGFISGFVSQGANKSAAVGDPIANATILVYDSTTNSPVGYTYSDVNGLFSFSNLDYGTYALYTDVLNMFADVRYVTISPDNTVVDNIQINVNETNTTEVQEVGGSYYRATAFPNPSSGKFSLSTIGLNGNYEMDIISVDGSLVERKNLNLDDNSVAEFSIETPGFYFVRISGNGISLIEKLVVR
jgi:PKD repeat protein